ncbi:MAG: hypothetical protein Aureis2KO_18050 [Aureisphaera sp.]
MNENQSFPFFSLGTEHVFSTISEINGRKAAIETVVQVKTAKVRFANYPLLMQDFPQLHESELLKRNPGLRTMDSDQRTWKIHRLIDTWLLHHGGYVSTSQAKNTLVNTKIETGSKETRAYRPLHYGRALIFSIEETIKSLGVLKEVGEQQSDRGLLDIKGVGVAPHRTPSHRTHGSGLMPLRGCYKELFMEQLIHQIFTNEKANHRTTPIYAIVDLGFDRVVLKTRLHEIKNKSIDSVEKLEQPAGLLFRRAHNRVDGRVDLPNYGTEHYQLTKNIEKMLRKYGMTSVSTPSQLKLCPRNKGFELWHGRFKKNGIKEGGIKNYLQNLAKVISGPITFDGVNVQLTGELRSNPSGGILVDFDHYEIRECFANPVLYMSSRYLCWGDLNWPIDGDFVQPSNGLAIPYDLLEGEGEVDGFPQYEIIKRKLITLCEGLVNALRKGQLTNEDVINRLQELMCSCIGHWKDH